MTMTWGPGRYDTSSQSSSAAGGSAGTACDCKKTCCIATTETHYRVTGSNTVANNNAIDGPNSSTLANRTAIEFYNAGTITFEVSTVSNFAYGDGAGRPVAPGASYSLQIGSGVQHYIVGAGGTYDCRVTEVGV